MPLELIILKQKLIIYSCVGYVVTNKMVNNISECSKLAQKKYKNRYDWVGKVIYRELCKRLKFGYTDKWYMHKLEFVHENKI